MKSAFFVLTKKNSRKTLRGHAEDKFKVAKFLLMANISFYCAIIGPSI